MTPHDVLDAARPFASLIAIATAIGCAHAEPVASPGTEGGDGVTSDRRTVAAPDPAPPRDPVAPSEPGGVRVEPVAFSLGELPERFEVAAPIPPRVVREQTADTVAELRAALTEGSVRITFRGRAEGTVPVEADDIQLLMAPGAFIEHLVLTPGTARVHVRGGEFGTITLAAPQRYRGGEVEYRESWKVHDVAIEDVRADADDTAFFLRGTRVALVRSSARARRYGVWSGDMGPFATEDLVVSDCRFDAAGPEATVRLVGVRRAVVVNNALSNTLKHNFRVHGRSDRIVFARNQLVETGVMIGMMPGDAIGTIWIVDNTLYHRSPSLFQVAPDAVAQLVARGNRVFSDEVPCFVCVEGPSEWEIGPHEVEAYRPPPQ